MFSWQFFIKGASGVGVLHSIVVLHADDDVFFDGGSGGLRVGLFIDGLRVNLVTLPSFLAEMFD